MKSTHYLIKIVFVTLALGILTGCAHGPRRSFSGQFQQVGIASWYGEEHAGKPTASGEIFDPDKLTAAHRTLPFQTQVRVQNLKNHKEVKVKINDRGPFVSGRIIDLSQEAARQIGMERDGIAKVKIKVIR